MYILPYCQAFFYFFKTAGFLTVFIRTTKSRYCHLCVVWNL